MNPSGSVLMMPLNLVYSAVTRARLAAYESGLFVVTKLSAPVISVGNLTTGGTGKTPLVEWVCRALVPGLENKRVCVLTRGYGRQNPEAQVVVSDGESITAGPREAGDEPFLLAENLLGVAAVLCNANRVGAGEWAIANLQTEVFVLDDGFQHLRLSRDLDIVTIDGSDPWGGGDLLPRGRLREPATSLKRADCVVITRANLTEDPERLKREIQKLAGNKPVFSSRMEIAGFRDIQGEAVDQLILKSQPLLAFCGVGNPQSFFTHLRREGFQLVSTHTYPDHFAYQQPDLDTLERKAESAGARGLITTAKDAVKLRQLHSKLPCYVMDIELSVDQPNHLAEMVRSVVAR